MSNHAWGQNRSTERRRRTLTIEFGAMGIELLLCLLLFEPAIAGEPAHLQFFRGSGPLGSACSSPMRMGTTNVRCCRETAWTTTRPSPWMANGSYSLPSVADRPTFSGFTRTGADWNG